MAIPGSLDKVVKAGGISPPEIIQANLSKALATGYLLVVSFAIFVCCLAIQASTIRLAYSMARDRQLPALEAAQHGAPDAPARRSAPASPSRCWPRSSSSSTRGVAYIAIAASGMIYLSYILANLAILRRAPARLLRAAPGAVLARRAGGCSSTSSRSCGAARC